MEINNGRHVPRTVFMVNERGQQVWLHAGPAESDACME